MKNILLIFTLPVVLTLHACTQGQSSGAGDDEQAKIQGKINHPATDGHVVLEEIGQSDVSVVDTFQVSEDSTFQYSLEEVKPGFYRINFYGKQYVNLILDDESVQITADGDRPDGLATVRRFHRYGSLQCGE